MTTLEQLSQAAQQLTPDELRERLGDLDQEQRVIRALLRATLKAKPGKPSAGEQSREIKPA